ncbi:MAG: lysophospholipid acyltransferase family protein [Rikenellaceae bacterium]
MFTILYYLEITVLCVIFILLSAVALVVCYPFDPARRVVHELSRLLVKSFFATPPLWRQSVEGLENIERGKSYVIVLNHNSMMDIPALYMLPLNFRWVSKREVYFTPFFGQLLFLHGDICIRRAKGSEAMTQLRHEGHMWIDRGVSIAIFPEGTRSKSGEIGRFKGGAFSLAREANVEILPVVINGTREMIKSNNLFNWRNRLTLKVLKPISVSGDDKEVGRDVIEGIRESMVEALKELRDRN